ncbi:MAG: glycosyltransferase [Acidobacteria bacterium]|nr:glycosyltransferase [Acidobacteriota bacterium]
MRRKNQTEFRTALLGKTVMPKADPRNRPEHSLQEGDIKISSTLISDTSVSVVVATLDRPDDLRGCLLHLVAQETSRSVEIIVVDNHPASGLTPPVVAEFAGVRLIAEERQGLAYARNKGILASQGEIVVATDDDVIAPPGWLEKLLAPFASPGVMVVTGNVLPLSLETKAERLYEAYGGLGRGSGRKVVDGDWFRKCRAAVPTWSLGATANAAFRTSIFSHSQIGLMHEALGPGMPSGTGEDIYVFYKVLKAGYTIVYEPAAWVWHKHRRDLPALRRQLFNYSKGHVAYHLTTLLRDGDWRAIINLAFLSPGTHVRRALRRLCGRDDYPLYMILLEVAGNLAGPWALWKSRQRVRREGPSTADKAGR